MKGAMHIENKNINAFFFFFTYSIIEHGVNNSANITENISHTSFFSFCDTFHDPALIFFPVLVIPETCLQESLTITCSPSVSSSIKCSAYDM